MEARPERLFKVAVTGLGLITPIGTGVDAFWKNLLAGTVGVKTIDRFDASSYTSRIAAAVDDFEPSQFMTKRRMQWTDRFSQLAVCASYLALQDAGLSGLGDRAAETGVYTGSALGGVSIAEDQVAIFYEHGLRRVSPLLTISVFGGAAASNIAIEFGLRGHSTANGNSCASGAMAIGDAAEAIAHGRIRAALAGGVEAPLKPLTYGAFVVARAMSTNNDDPQHASRPFDANRDGFVMAEGAGMVLLERMDDAVARGARIYGEIAGYGTSNDAFHMSAPLEGGDETATAMKRALDDAHMTPDEVEAINAHGSSTKLGDRAETRALGRVFGDRLSRIPVTATKGQHGHALGTTGAWEIAVALLGMRDGVVPGAVNLRERDPECELDITASPRDIRTRVVLSNSSGFGGINCALVLVGCASSSG
ncbi:MAG TPA: beta-ketoacyl-[acyl-carrier-protein] synthase family protein [Candidatus Baltobacteraceae bacterium]|nr:beta-ketoacyl-[acyl-carrier-protein] synthase family protein [Candidatus Baltobacteraceae bacterium]